MARMLPSPRSLSAGLPLAAAGVVAAAFAALAATPDALGHCEFEVTALGVTAAVATGAWLLRARHPGASLATGAIALALSAFLLRLDVGVARDLRALRRLYAAAQVECAATPHKLEWQIACDLDLGCDETTPFQVSCERDVYGRVKPTKAYLVEGADSGWVLGPDAPGGAATLDRY